VEQTRRPTLAHHDHRATQMGALVVINAGWYKVMPCPNIQQISADM
jgi:hypothetical protein